MTLGGIKSLALQRIVSSANRGVCAECLKSFMEGYSSAEGPRIKVDTCTALDIRNVGVDLTIGESRVVGVTEKRY